MKALKVSRNAGSLAMDLAWHDAEGWHPIGSYSTDIAAAWQVVEKMKMTVYAPGAPYADGEYYNGSFWVAECDSVTPRSPSAEGVADTAPLAISIAALKAVGMEVPS